MIKMLDVQICGCYIGSYSKYHNLKYCNNDYDILHGRENKFNVLYFVISMEKLASLIVKKKKFEKDGKIICRMKFERKI